MKTYIVVPVIIIVLALGAWFVTTLSTSSPAPVQSGDTMTNAYGTSTAPIAQTTSDSQANPVTNNQVKIMHATLHTNKGDIVIEFDATNAPNTVANFIKLAQAGFYDGTKFHRVI